MIHAKESTFSPRVFPSRATFFIEPIMISTWYFPAPTTQATRSLHWLCRRLKKQNIDPTINSTDSSILNRPCAVSFYIEDFRETWTRKFHHRDFCFLKSPWCVRNPAYLPIKYRERPQIAIIWLFDRCISLNSTYSKMIYYEIGSKRSLRIRKAKWQRRTNYITQALSGHARVSRHVVKLYKRSPSVKTSNIARTCHQNLIKGFVQFSENMAPVAASFIVVIAGKIASFDLQSPTLLTLIFVDYGTLGVILLSTWWKQHREKNDDLCFCRVDYKVF